MRSPPKKGLKSCKYDCICQDCFHDWWDSFTRKEQTRIMMWSYYIEQQAPKIPLRRPGLHFVHPESSKNVDANRKQSDAEVFDNEVSINEWEGYGLRLADDEIDIYCDRLQKAASRKELAIEGCLAIQYVQMCLGAIPEEFHSNVTGENVVLQVIFDPTRTGHFLLLEWSPSDRVVVVYDSLVPLDEEANNTLTEPVRQQIKALFGHLYPESIPVKIEVNIEAQEDSWSCGLRVIGMLTRRVFNQPATCTLYTLEKIWNLKRAILAHPEPSLSDFAIVPCIIYLDESRRAHRRDPIERYIAK